MHNFIESAICMGNERVRNPVHPTQKPLKVLNHLLQLATKPGDVVCDPFMGVGSTGVSALRLGRCFIGIERDPLYFKAATKRIEEITPILFPDDEMEDTQQASTEEGEELTPEEAENLSSWEWA